MNTKLIALVVLASAQFASGQERIADTAELLNAISSICGDRWSVDVGDGSHIYLNSKRKALGEALGYNFGPGEQEYNLHFRFKLVTPVGVADAANARAKLKELKAKGESIEARIPSPEVTYAPKSVDDWSLVLSILRTKARIEDIPEYRFKSVYLSVDYAMDFFVPNKRDANALAYKQDIDKIYNLLQTTHPE